MRRRSHEFGVGQAIVNNIKDSKPMDEFAIFLKCRLIKLTLISMELAVGRENHLSQASALRNVEREKDDRLQSGESTALTFLRQIAPKTDCNGLCRSVLTHSLT